MIETKRAHPNALFLVHPECSEEVTNLADFVGSTSEIIKFATNSEEKEFIIGTENGVMYELKQKNPDKLFLPAIPRQYCDDMKKVTLTKVKDSLVNERYVAEVDEELSIKAMKPLEKMLELAK